MDAVEVVMREDGYAALTARRVAERASLNYQLVFYYFGTMDELVLATYRRHIGQHRDTMKQALCSDRPLHAYWSVSSNPHDAVLNMEFMAMSNHNETVRAETILFGEELRRFNLEHVAPAITAVTANGEITPASVMMVLNYIGSLLGLETALGISGVHDEIRRLVGWCVDRLEPGHASS
jgi:AcrR family transcriptional regulator